jgi:16S rRNA (cytosine1402-N4)-methyltransferase
LNPHLLLGVDRDLEALEIARNKLSGFKSQIKLIHLEFSQISKYIQQSNFPRFHGVLLDLGLSSLQLDSPRGFSYRFNCPLDMRMNRNQSITALDLIVKSNQEELREMLILGGETQFADRLAQKIYQQKKAIKTTEDLSEIIRSVGPRSNVVKRLARTYQAFRIAINDEYSQLNSFLENLTGFLQPEAVLVTIAYHSGEDRIIKQYQKKWKKDNLAKPLFSHVIKPSREERNRNPRSRSAKLRVIRFQL